MPDASLWLALFAAASGGQPRQAPAYSAASIVNAASNQPGALSANALLTIYGSELSFGTGALNQAEIRQGFLPVAPLGLAVSVQFGALFGHILYASPNQINVLAPANLRPGRIRLRVVRQGLSGPEIDVEMKAAAPGLFVAGDWAIAGKADGSLATPGSPAAPEEVAVLYATGLGETVPRQEYGRVAAAAARIAGMDEFDVLLDGAPVDRKRILYAGVTPGFAGLYQVNVLLPEPPGPDPEVRLRVAGAESPAGVRLPLRTRPQP